MKSKRTTIEKSLFKKYIIGFIIFQILFQVAAQTGISIMTNISAKNAFSSEDVYKEIDENGIEEVYENKKVPEDAYVEILDLDYKVLDSLNSPHNTGYIYNKEDIKKISNNKIEALRLYFLIKSQEFLIVKEQPLNRKSVPYTVSVLLFLISLLFMIVIFFKIMAKNVSGTLEKPLMELIDGVNAFKNKNYSYRITFKANNEFDDLKDTFNNMADALQKEMELRQEAQNINKHLILDITHDLKTPLTNIKGYSELLRYNKALDTDTKNQYLDIVISNSQRTSKLITDLFDLTYNDLKSTGSDRQRTDFAEMLRRLLAEYIAVLEDKNNEYEFNIPSEAIWVNMDNKMVDRAICNILNNFLKYCTENAKIIVTLKECLNYIELTISDNGPGIPKESCEAAFLPFVTGDLSRNSSRGGTGLGLSIAKKVFENHGGSIKLFSDINQGCTFIIKMPKIS
jgi:signal transduction histidine kinase